MLPQIASRFGVLNTYRELLRVAKVYPSVKRESITQEIKDAYRENRNLEDPKKLASAENEAKAALNIMSRFKTVDSSETFTYTWQ